MRARLPFAAAFLVAGLALATQSAAVGPDCAGGLEGMECRMWLPLSRATATTGNPQDAIECGRVSCLAWVRGSASYCFTPGSLEMCHLMGAAFQTDQAEACLAEAEGCAPRCAPWYEYLVCEGYGLWLQV